jgi:hypothetical protein
MTYKVMHLSIRLLFGVAMVDTLFFSSWPGPRTETLRGNDIGDLAVSLRTAMDRLIGLTGSAIARFAVACLGC